MTSSRARLAVLARLFLAGGLAAGSAACAPGLDMARVHAEDVATRVTVDFDPAGDVFLCGKPFGTWTGSRLEAAGADLFALDRDYLVVKGKRTMRVEADEVVAVTAEPTHEILFRIGPGGDILDRTGKHVATLRPPPRDPRVALAALAALENAAVLHGIAHAMSLGKYNPCGLPKPGPTPDARR